MHLFLGSAGQNYNRRNDLAILELTPLYTLVVKALRVVAELLRKYQKLPAIMEQRSFLGVEGIHFSAKSKA